MQIQFSDCVLDVKRRVLRRNGAVVHTRAKVFDILSYLAANRDRVLSREELLARGWPGLTVSDGTLSSCIQGVRRVIGDNGSDPKIVQTLRGQGFRFIAEVRTIDDPADMAGKDSGAAKATEEPDAGPVRNDSLSVAVLPFVNLNDISKLDHLADGLLEDVMTSLSRFKAMTIIARRSSSLYQGSRKDSRTIGSELSADYILSGSVRSSGDEFRVTAQLVHAATMQHVWAENYDGRIGQLFAWQDDNSQRIAGRIKPEIDLAEIRRASEEEPGTGSARDMAWQGRALMERSRLESDPALFAKGMDLAERAAAANANCRQAWWTICLANFLLGFARRVDNPARHLKRATAAAEKLRALDRNDHSAYMALGWINHIERKFDRSLRHLNQAHTLNPNCTMTLMFLGYVHTSLGKPEEAYEFLDRAMRLSPRDIWLGFMIGAQAFACFAMERYDEGVELSLQAIEREPHAPANHVILAACLAGSGDLDGAARAIRAQRKINAAYLQEYLERKRLPLQNPAHAERLARALIGAAERADRMS